MSRPVPLVLAAVGALLISCALVAADITAGLNALQTPNARKSAKLPPCKLCSALTGSFRNGLERTARGKHGGGDAAWEEQRLGTYKRSELRLVEIQEQLCKDAARGEDQCHELAEQHESAIEEWWQKLTADVEDAAAADQLHRWLCIEQLRVCCEPNQFGADCAECSDCGGNGKCKGAGTRKGNGKCACDTGYQGERCNECDAQHYESFRDADKLLCSRCHSACAASGGCTGAGPKACRVCAGGWQMLPEQGGCVDVDECAVAELGGKGATCKRNQFCVNNEGSFTCLECDKSCNGCSGDGPDECRACADGFELRDGLCKDLTNERRETYSTYMRYVTYFGLCVATFVIFQNSVYAASAIGLGVGLYISLAEYYLYSNPGPKDGGQPQPAGMEAMGQQMMQQIIAGGGAGGE